MTKICEGLTENLNEIEEEYTEYEIDISDEYATLLTQEKELEEKIIALNKEIKALEEKEANGTITEEEKAELVAKRGELSNLVSSSKRNEMNNLLDQSEKRNDELKSKLEFAKDVGDTTLEHGQELANTKVKKANWFRKLFGITKNQKQRKAIGEKAVDVSTNLLKQVNTLETKTNKKEVTNL